MKSHFKMYAGHRHSEQGVTMLLVAVGMTFMILAIAALAIDLTALYSARNDARMAADAAALAGARVAANSGISTDTNVPQASVSALAIQVATAVATQNKVGGRTLLASEVTSNPSYAIPGSPRISVTVQRTDLPTFFARIWGNAVLPVSATAVAEAYNPSGNTVPVQPQCVKPWLLPNIKPGGGQIIDPASGNVLALPVIGNPPFALTPGCANTGCTPLPTVAASKYYYAQLTPPLGTELPATCALGSCAYEQNIAACSPQPISCGPLATVQVDVAGCGANNYTTLTTNATSCLIHSAGGTGQDCIGNLTAQCGGVSPPPLATQFMAGANNQLVKDGLTNLGDLVSNSDSLVTIPVINSIGGTLPNPATVIGFVQGFVVGSVPGTGQINLAVVNIAGCGAGVTGTPVIGDGVSPVPVHLISY